MIFGFSNSIRLGTLHNYSTNFFRSKPLYNLSFPIVSRMTDPTSCSITTVPVDETAIKKAIESFSSVKSVAEMPSLTPHHGQSYKMLSRLPSSSWFEYQASFSKNLFRGHTGS
uniref:Uncharacterized protein n=1 Tax=Romanomermis culicivorax TaxID=13658 RepID=A0A915L6I0_ROMCU